MTEGALDPNEVAQYLQKKVLIGLSYYNGELKLSELRQYFGVIESIDSEGIKVRHPETGEEFTLPPDLKALKTGEKGTYRLRSTGEVVKDPDFFAQYDIYQDVPPTPDDIER